MTYTPNLWTDAEDITAAKLNNIEGQYDAAKTDFGAITVTVTVAIDGTSIHAIGADYLIPIGSITAETTINAAIHAAVAAGGGEVLLLEGTYVCGGPVLMHDNITLSGMGGNTVLKVKAGLNANVNLIQNDAAVAPGNKNMVVKDLVVDGNSWNQTSGDQQGIYFVNCNDTVGRIIIRNVYARYFRYNGIWINACKGVIIDKCTAYGCPTHAGIATSSSVCQITNCSVSNNAYGLWISAASDSVIGNLDASSNTVDGILLTAASTRVALTGCTLYNNYNGLHINGSTYCSALGNTFRNNSWYGAFIENSSYNSIVGNSFYENTGGIGATASWFLTVSSNTIASSTGRGLYFYTSASYCTIANNVVYKNGLDGIAIVSCSRNVIGSNNSSGNGQQGIGKSNIALATSHDHTIVGNRCHKGGGPNYPTTGIFIGAGCNNNLVTANNCKDGGATHMVYDAGTGTDKTAWMVAGNKIA